MEPTGGCMEPRPVSAKHAHSHSPANFSRACVVGIALNIAFVAIEAY
jgi:cobalt-zinc-cadmium efflux system protein